MQRDPKKYLHDMLDSSQFAVRFSAGRTSADLHNNRGFRSAIERELQIIGEALWNLEKLDPSLAGKISEHRRIIRFRHVLVHGYDSIDYDVTWAVIAEKLPILICELRQLLEDAEASDSDT